MSEIQILQLLIDLRRTRHLGRYVKIEALKKYINDRECTIIEFRALMSANSVCSVLTLKAMNAMFSEHVIRFLKPLVRPLEKDVDWKADSYLKHILNDWAHDLLERQEWEHNSTSDFHNVENRARTYAKQAAVRELKKFFEIDQRAPIF